MVYTNDKIINKHLLKTIHIRWLEYNLLTYLKMKYYIHRYKNRDK